MSGFLSSTNHYFCSQSRWHFTAVISSLAVIFTLLNRTKSVTRNRFDANCILKFSDCNCLLVALSKSTVLSVCHTVLSVCHTVLSVCHTVLSYSKWIYNKNILRKNNCISFPLQSTWSFQTVFFDIQYTKAWYNSPRWYRMGLISLTPNIYHKPSV